MITTTVTHYRIIVNEILYGRRPHNNRVEARIILATFAEERRPAGDDRRQPGSGDTSAAFAGPPRFRSGPFANNNVVTFVTYYTHDMPADSTAVASQLTMADRCVHASRTCNMLCYNGRRDVIIII